jgi:hypothetical protein
MNTAEQIVDAYFRLCRACFTISDRKVVKGNNRQIDILAYHLKTKTAYHVEVGVTHRENWCPTIEILRDKFDHKFFGKPAEKSNKSPNTDAAKNKNYFDKIEKTYESVGLDRVWVCWMVRGRDDSAPFTLTHEVPHLPGRRFEIEVLSMRDYVLDKLEEAIGTSNYDDVILRTIGFIKQREEQEAEPGDENDED